MSQLTFDATALTASGIGAAGPLGTRAPRPTVVGLLDNVCARRAVFVGVFALALLGCGGKARPAATTPVVPTPSVQVGQCGEPGRDGVMGAAPKVDRADRDLDGDNIVESIVVDRGMCTSDGNCYWNVFRSTPPASLSSGTTECSRYVGTFAGAALEPLADKGDDNMRDVRGYWNLQGGRLLLQSYRFVRGGYQLTDALLCKRAADDRLECAEDR